MRVPGGGLAARLAEASLARPRAWIVGAATLTAGLAILAGRVPGEVGYAAYFGPASPEVRRLAAFLDEFESGFHLLIVFSCRETTRCQRIDEPWALDFLGRLHGAADRLPNVRRTWSLLNAPIVTGPLETRTLAADGADAVVGGPPWRLAPAWPSLLQLGLMGWSGIGIDPASAMVGAILLALGVDDTIHPGLRWRAARAGGHDGAAAWSETLDSVGEAVVITSLCLGLGFSVLLFARWGGLVSFGLVASLGVALLLAGDLLLLPAALLAGERRPESAR
jgi:predicted RND superfamily exporter protein